MYLKSLGLSLISVAILGCNSSSNDSTPKTPTIPPVTVTPTPVPDSPIPIEISCEGMARLPIASSNSSHQTGAFLAGNAIDQSFVSSSYWSSSNADAFLTAELTETSLIKGVSVTWSNPDNRTYSYDIALS